MGARFDFLQSMQTLKLSYEKLYTNKILIDQILGAPESARSPNDEHIYFENFNKLLIARAHVNSSLLKRFERVDLE